MPLIKTKKITLLMVLFTLVLLCSSCSGKYQNKRFTFKAPGGVKIKTLILDGQPKVTLNTGNLYFAITQREIEPGSTMQEIYQAYRTQTESRMHKYLFISETGVVFRGLPAIEYVYRGFSGEPYVQRRELWFEKGGWVYQLLCSDPVNFTENPELPVDEGCYQLAEGFQFRE